MSNVRQFSFRAWHVRQAVNAAASLEALRQAILAGLREIRCLLRYGYDCGLPTCDLVPIGFTSRVGCLARDESTPESQLISSAQAVAVFLEQVEAWLFAEELEPPVYSVAELTA